MPIYEYKCNKCGYIFEALVFSNQPTTKCPKCESEDLTKLMSATSSYTGSSNTTIPGPGDTACCGYRPGEAPGCPGPGSCCGRNRN